MKQTEAQIQSACIDLLNIYEKQGKLWYHRNNTIGVFDKARNKYRTTKGQKKGISDIMILVSGKTVFVEVKSENGKLSNYQHDFRDICCKNGTPYHIVRDCDDLRKVVEKYLNGGGCEDRKQ